MALLVIGRRGGASRGVRRHAAALAGRRLRPGQPGPPARRRPARPRSRVADAERLVDAASRPQRGRLVQPRLPARRDWSSTTAAEAAFRRALALDPEARPGLVRARPGADPPGPARRGRRGAEAQHRIATDEPVRLVPAGAGARRPAASPRRRAGSSRTCSGSSPRWRRSWSARPGWRRDAQLEPGFESGAASGGTRRPTGDRLRHRGGSRTVVEGEDNGMQLTERHHEYWRKNADRSPGSCWPSGSS